MTIDEAIRELEDEQLEYLLGDRPEFVAALQLGIEALTYIKLLRETNPRDVPALFHGETKEQVKRR